MRRVFKLVVNFIYRPLLLKYLRKDRYYSFEGERVLVRKGVFHPGFFFSTKLLLQVLSTLNLKEKKLLELGAGSGLISSYASGKGARVTASDINANAVQGLLENAAPENKIGKKEVKRFDVILSDLFDYIPAQKFDYIVINPPYYAKQPVNDEERAWYCGTNFEYFEKLFFQLKLFSTNGTCILMSLSEDCNLNKINAIAQKHHYRLEEIRVKKSWLEKHFVFSIIQVR